VVFFLVFAIWLLVREGFAVNPDTGEVYMEKFKYLHNLLAMPLVLVMFLLGVLAVLAGIALPLLKKHTNGIWFTGLGTIVVVFSLFMLAGFNNTAFYPSAFDLQSSLTIRNASSSHYTLVAMSWVSLFVPFVLAYIVVAWRSINRKKIDEKEMQEESHVY
jgi:cytochrome d ubiquinol oxidase subunit II